MIIYNLDGCGCQLNDPIMSPSYNQVINGQDKPIKVVKVARANKMCDILHLQTTLKDDSYDNAIFIRCHKNFKITSKYNK